MAWYYVNYSCGHEERIQLYGKETERKKRIEWFEEFDNCSQCKALVKKEKVEEQNKELPPLTSGSDKQIAWVMKIRGEFSEANIEHQNKDAVTLKKVGEPEALSNMYQEAAKEYAEFLTSKTEAKWWIDQRDELGQHSFRMRLFKKIINCEMYKDKGTRDDVELVEELEELEELVSLKMHEFLPFFLTK